MAILKLCGLALLASLALTVFGSEKPIQPVAYLIDTLPIDIDAEAETPESHASFVRDGTTYPAFEGMEVYPGDIVSTPAGGGILVAFLNNSTIQLHESSKLTIEELAVAAVDTGIPVTVNMGHVFVQTRSSETDSLSIGFGDVHTAIARAKAPKPTSLDIIVTGTPGNYVTNVGVLAGSVTLTPNGSNQVNLTSGTLALLTANTPVAGVSGTPVTISTVNLSKAQLAALKLGDLSETFVKVGKGGSVSFKSTIHNPDGSITKGSFTTLNGITTKDAWKTTGANKFSESWSESSKGITVKQTFNGDSFSGKFVGNTSSKATVKIGKSSYTGTATYDPTTGIMTFTTVKAAKDGSTATFTFNPNAAGGATQTLVVTPKGGVAGTPITHVVPVGAPPANTPDLRGITQNQPPVSH